MTALAVRPSARIRPVLSACGAGALALAMALLLPTGGGVQAQNPSLPTGEIPAAQGFQPGAEVGTQVPDVELLDAEGQRRSFREFRGKVVLVNFWASWCGPCRREMPEFKAMRGEYAAQGFEVVAVNVDRERSRAAGFLEGISPDFPIWYDPEAASMGQFGVSSMPTSFLVDRDGVIRHKVVGYREADLPTWRRQIERWTSR